MRAYLATMLLDQHDALTAQIDQLSARIEQAVTAVPAAGPPATASPGCDPTTGEIRRAAAAAVLDLRLGCRLAGLLAEMGVQHVGRGGAACSGSLYIRYITIVLDVGTCFC